VSAEPDGPALTVSGRAARNRAVGRSGGGIHAVPADVGFAVAASVNRAAELPDPAAVDLVLLGPDEQRERVIGTIARLRRYTSILLFGAPSDPQHLAAAIRAGASGYLTDSADDAMIQSAARSATAGGFTVSAELAEALLTHFRPAAPRRTADMAALSPREREALRWIAHGLTHAQTATRMQVSKPTVDTYVARARRKPKLGNKAELTRAVLEMDTNLSAAS
jgi:DNA-binding NarL/FixJ family response regulator